MVYVTTANKVEAEKIAHVLLNERLIACANIIGSVSSYFHWNGKVDSAEECLMVMKARADLFVTLESRIIALHSYDVPEILAVSIVDGSKGYFDWMSSALNR
jgi:periplasmic divalent cation tolerance protein